MPDFSFLASGWVYCPSVIAFGISCFWLTETLNRAFARRITLGLYAWVLVLLYFAAKGGAVLDVLGVLVVFGYVLASVAGLVATVALLAAFIWPFSEANKRYARRARSLG